MAVLPSLAMGDARLPSGNGRATARRATAILAGALLLYLAVIALSAWHCDDAWITFRTVRNFWEGHGLRWNATERVQAYTHPLWMMVGIACYGIAGELYFSILAVSIALSLTTAWRLGRLAPWQPAGAIGVLLAEQDPSRLCGRCHLSLAPPSTLEEARRNPARTPPAPMPGDEHVPGADCLGCHTAHKR